MAMSPEYPDLKWVVPRSWTRGRPAPPRVIVIHTTEGHEHATAAEDGAAYDARRTDGTSAHYFVDPNSIVQCVRTRDTAHTARYNGNRIGIQYELCGRAGQTDAQWHDANSQALLKRAAKQAARDATKYGIPPVKLSSAQVRAGKKGFCGHVDITYAYPADRGSHTDPGKRFPWDEFLGLVKQHLGVTPPPKKETEMQLTDIVYRTGDGKVRNVDAILEAGDTRTALLLDEMNVLQANVVGLTAAVGKLAESVGAATGVDPEALKQAVADAIAANVAVIADASAQATVAEIAD